MPGFCPAMLKPDAAAAPVLKPDAAPAPLLKPCAAPAPVLTLGARVVTGGWNVAGVDANPPTTAAAMGFWVATEPLLFLAAVAAVCWLGCETVLGIPNRRAIPRVCGVMVDCVSACTCLG